MKVSAVLPIHNGEKFIAKCINSLIRQSVKFNEIIIVDDASTDNSVKLIKKFPVRLIQLNKNLGRSAARNKGFEESKNEIVFFAEDDAFYGKDFLKYCLPHFKNKKVAGVIGKQFVSNANESIWTKCKDAERKSTFQNYIPFSVWMYRRELFKRAKGFDEKIDYGEDVDLSQRIKKMGFKLVYEPKAKWFHYEPNSLKKIIQRSWNFGLGIGSFYKKNNYPKTVLLDFLFFLSFPVSVFFPSALIYPSIFLLLKLTISFRFFSFLKLRHWLFGFVFILLPSIVFKFSRLIGLIRNAF